MTYMDSIDFSPEAQHDRLVDEIKSYWVGKGWRLSTLTAKSTRELLGIRNTMYRQLAKETQKPIVTATQKRKSTVAVQEQGNLFDHVINTNDKKPVQNSPIRRNQYRQIILLDEED